MLAPLIFTRLRIEEVLILFLSLWLATSLLMSEVPDTARVLAAYYSVGLLIALALVSQSTRFRFEAATDEEVYSCLRQSFGLLFACCTVFVFAGLIIGFGMGQMSFSFPTVLGLVSPVSLPGIAERSMIAEVIRPDWGFGAFAMPRPLTFAPWYTAGAMTIFASGLYYMMARVAQGARIRTEVLLEGLIFFLLFIALSRTTLAMYGLGFMLGAFIFRDSARTLFVFLLLGIGALALLAVGINFNPLEFRNYSTETRFSAYRLGIEYSIDRSFLFGIGYKPHSSEVNVPIGSHSSFISFIVRGGLPAGVIFFFAFYIFPLLRWLQKIPQLRKLDLRRRKIAQFAFRFQILIWGWLPFQEVDTAAIASTLVFIGLAINLVLVERLTSPADHTSIS